MKEQFTEKLIKIFNKQIENYSTTLKKDNLKKWNLFPVLTLKLEKI